MSKRSRGDAVVGEDGVWPGHLLRAVNQMGAQRTRRPTTRPARHSPIINSDLLQLILSQGHPDYPPTGYTLYIRSRIILGQPRRNIVTLHTGTPADGMPRFIVRNMPSHVCWLRRRMDPILYLCLHTAKFCHLSRDSLTYGVV
jgi:hypothetical protein